MDNFFCQRRNDNNKIHWASSKNMRILYDEGDVGIKNIEDICMAFQQKQW